MLVHAGFPRGYLVLGECARGHGDDGNRGGVGPVHRANLARRRIAVHPRHHHVHQYRVDLAWGALRERFNRLPAVACCGDGRAFPFEQEVRDFHVQLVVLGQKNAQAVDGCGRSLFRRRFAYRIAAVDFKRDDNVERGAFALRAFNGNGAAHLVDEVLGDRHAQPRAAVFRTRRLGFLRERLEQLLKEVLRHSDAGVTAFELDERCIAFAGDFPASDEYLPVRLVVLDRVAQDVRHDALEMHRAAHQLDVLRFAVFLDDLDAATFRLLDDDGVDASGNLAQVERDVLQDDFPRLQLVHVQHFVDEL